MRTPGVPRDIPTGVFAGDGVLSSFLKTIVFIPFTHVYKSRSHPNTPFPTIIILHFFVQVLNKKFVTGSGRLKHGFYFTLPSVYLRYWKGGERSTPLFTMFVYRSVSFGPLHELRSTIGHQSFFLHLVECRVWVLPNFTLFAYVPTSFLFLIIFPSVSREVFLMVSGNVELSPLCENLVNRKTFLGFSVFSFC